MKVGESSANEERTVYYVWRKKQVERKQSERVYSPSEGMKSRRTGTETRRKMRTALNRRGQLAFPKQARVKRDDEQGCRQSTDPLAFPNSSSNRSRSRKSFVSTSFDSFVTTTMCPLSMINASHSRMNCSRSLTRVMESSGSLEPRARARYDATTVAIPPVKEKKMSRYMRVGMPMGMFIPRMEVAIDV